MAQRSKDELVAALAALRTELSATGTAFQRTANPVAALRRNIRAHQPAWLGVSAIAGAILSRLPARKAGIRIDTPQKKQADVAQAGAFLGLAKIAADVARPAITTWIKKRFSGTGGKGG